MRNTLAAIRIPGRWIIAAVTLAMAVALLAFAPLSRPGGAHEIGGLTNLILPVYDGALGAPQGIGVGVDNLAAAKAGMTATNNTSWMDDRIDPNVAVVYRANGAGSIKRFDYKVAVSNNPGPLLFLEEVRPAGDPTGPHPYPYQWDETSLSNASSLHNQKGASFHLMWVVHDIVAASRHLESLGFPMVMTRAANQIIPDANQNFADGYALHKGPNGIVLEFLDDSLVTGIGGL